MYLQLTWNEFEDTQYEINAWPRCIVYVSCAYCRTLDEVRDGLAAVSKVNSACTVKPQKPKHTPGLKLDFGAARARTLLSSPSSAPPCCLIDLKLWICIDKAIEFSKVCA